jgi:hypothetical protein
VVRVDVGEFCRDHVLEELASGLGEVFDQVTRNIDKLSCKTLELLHFFVRNRLRHLDQLVLDQMEALATWTLKLSHNFRDQQLKRGL